MSVALTVLIVVGLLLAAVVVVVAAAVLIPIHVRAAGTVRDDELSGELWARWGWGLVGLRLGWERGAELELLGRRVRGLGRAEKTEKKSKKKKKKAKKRQWRALDPRVVARMLRRVLAGLHARLSAEGCVGLGDPADTAVLFEVLRWAQPPWDGIRLQVEPDYLEAVVELDAALSARVWPAEFGIIFLGFLIDPQTRRVLRAAA
jgi:hypothetical protein